MTRIAKLTFFLWFLAPLLASAQGASELNILIFKLFGEHDNFAVDSEFQVLDPKQRKLIMTMTLGIAVSGGKMRADADMNSAKGVAITADDIRQLKATGEDRVISIIRTDKNLITMIYPNKKSYTETPLPKDYSSVTKLPKFQKTPIATVTMDGHKCVKKKVVLTDDKGAKQEMITWEAEDLKNFPLQVQLTDNGQEMIIHNRNIRFGKIDTVHFDVPATFTKSVDTPPQKAKKK
jgi:hypothetical protein